ncbi:MAG: ABC transporter ATP-binding protein [Planctomycetota bacterium]
MIEVQALQRTFGKLNALEDVTFECPAATITGFIGPNGAGKTTTLRILATLEVADAGDARIGGFSVLSQPREVVRLLGFMPDFLGAYPNMTVVECLDFYARAFGLKGSARRERLADIIDFVGLDPMVDRLVTKLSKGMRQRVSLARALIHDPEVLLLDEPASGLDPRARRELRELLKILAEQGRTILISSHILHELTDLCDRVVVVEAGRVLTSGRVQDVERALRRGRSLKVRLLESDERLRRFLLEQPHVQQVELTLDGATFGFEGDEQEQVALLKKLFESGFPIREVRELESTLEDLFLELTKGQLQ